MPTITLPDVFTDDRNRLRTLIAERSFSLGVERTLASGRTSNFYFNMKPTMLHPVGAHLIGRLLHAALTDEKIDAVGGLEMGAVPLATSVAAVSGNTDRPLPAFFVRKEAKAHGTSALIEGPAAGESLKGKRVCVLEDVTTTGGSALKAVAVLQDAGAEVALVLTLVDRQEGAQAAFEDAGMRFEALYTADEFLSETS